MLITKVSNLSGKTHSLEIAVTQKELDYYYANPERHIQHVFPNLTPDEREFMNTGITAEEWDNLFGKG